MRIRDALQELQLDAEMSMKGRWARIQKERCSVYVVEMTRHRGFLTWCDNPDERVVEFHENALDAIQSGLQRAERFRGDDKDDTICH